MFGGCFIELETDKIIVRKMLKILSNPIRIIFLHFSIPVIQVFVDSIVKILQEFAIFFLQMCLEDVLSS